MKTIDYPLVTCQSIETNTIFCTFRKALKVDLPSAREIVANRLHFSDNRAHYLVVDASNVRGLTPEAKLYLQNPEGGLKNILGAAIIASNPVSALIANIFVKTPKKFQARFFYTQKDALAWVLEIIRKNELPDFIQILN